MRAVTDFADYELLDASAGERLERWRNIILIRPDPQIIWDTPRQNPLWKRPTPGITVPPAGAGTGRPTERCRMSGKSAIRICGLT